MYSEWRWVSTSQALRGLTLGRDTDDDAQDWLRATRPKIQEGKLDFF